MAGAHDWQGPLTAPKQPPPALTSHLSPPSLPQKPYLTPRQAPGPACSPKVAKIGKMICCWCTVAEVCLEWDKESLPCQEFCACVWAGSARGRSRGGGTAASAGLARLHCPGHAILLSLRPRVTRDHTPIFSKPQNFPFPHLSQCWSAMSKSFYFYWVRKRRSPWSVQRRFGERLGGAVCRVARHGGGAVRGQITPALSCQPLHHLLPPPLFRPEKTGWKVQPTFPRPPPFPDVLLCGQVAGWRDLGMPTMSLSDGIGMGAIQNIRRIPTLSPQLHSIAATHFLRPAQLFIDTVSSKVSVTEFLPKNITLIVHFEFPYFDGLRKRLEEVKWLSTDKLSFTSLGRGKNRFSSEINFWQLVAAKMKDWPPVLGPGKN